MDSHYAVYFPGVLPGKEVLQLVMYCLMSSLLQIPLFGIMSSDSADPFYWLRVIMASNRGESNHSEPGPPFDSVVFRYVDGIRDQSYCHLLSNYASEFFFVYPVGIHFVFCSFWLVPRYLK